MITTFVFVVSVVAIMIALLFIMISLSKIMEHQSKIFRNVVDIKNLLERGKRYEKRDC